MRKGPRRLPKKGPYPHTNVNGLRVFGIDKVLRSLKKESEDIYQNSFVGLYKGGLLVLRDATIGCPIDLGNLRASGFVMGFGPKIKGTKTKRLRGNAPKFVDERAASKSVKPGRAARMSSDHQEVLGKHKSVIGGRKHPMVVVGFTAFYAIFVHEDPYAHHTKGHFKFLYLAIRKNNAKILEMIKEEAKL